MVNGFRYCRALESVSIASALSTALNIYPCQIRVHQHWQSKLQLPTARKKEWRLATAGSSPHVVTCQHCDTHYFSRPRTHNLLIIGWLLVRRATSSTTEPTWAQNVCSHGLVQRQKYRLIFMAILVFQVMKSLVVPGIAYSMGGQISGWNQWALYATAVGSESVHSWFYSV